MLTRQRQQLDELFENYIREEQANDAIDRVRNKQPVQRAQGNFSSGPRRNKNASVHMPLEASSVPREQHHFLSSRPLPPSTTPIVPNDSAAPAAQMGARDLTESILRQKATPAVSGPRGRSPTRQRTTSPDDAMNSTKGGVYWAPKQPVFPSEVSNSVQVKAHNQDEHPSASEDEPAQSPPPNRVRFSDIPGAVDFSAANEHTDPNKMKDAVFASFMDQVKMADAKITTPKN